MVVDPEEGLSPFSPSLPRRGEREGGQYTMLHLSHLYPFTPYGVGGGGSERGGVVGWNTRGKRNTSYP